MIQPERVSTCGDDRTALEAFRARVMASEAATAALCDIENPELYVASALQVAAGLGIALAEMSIRQAMRADPLNVARFMPRPPDGTVWPPPQWLPVHVAAFNDQVFVDWAFFGPAPLTDPFFEGSARHAARLPFNRMFRYRMTLDDFVADAPRHDCLKPDGFIFHMSRCGSTLVSQMLAAVPGTIAVSEAAPIDTIVHLCGASPDIAPQAQDALLAAMIAAFGRRRGVGENRYFIKMDCWHSLALPLFRRVFPVTPWLFLYRDPVEVLVSHVRQRGSQMVPELTPAQLYGIDDFNGVPDNDYCARVLAAICDAAAGQLDKGPDNLGIAVDYRELPSAVTSRILPHFALPCGSAATAAMASTARRDAKTPHVAFVDDSPGKQRDAGAALRAIAENRLAAVYRRLEALNRPV
jgi:hypothetical protein